MSALQAQLEGSVAIERANDAQPTNLLQLAIMQGAAIDTIERLAKLQREEREYQAMVDFDEALSRCQSRMKRIAADMTNPQTHSKYASYAALDRAIRPEYVAEGFSVSYSEAEGSTAEYITMLAFLTRAGHTRTYRKGMPIDTKGPKGNDVMTKTHAAGSGGSYAKRYLLKDIFNLAIGEDDIDGNGPEAVVPVGQMDTDEFDYHLHRIESAKEMTNLFSIFKAAYIAAQKINDQSAMAQFGKAKELRKKELACE